MIDGHVTFRPRNISLVVASLFCFALFSVFLVSSSSFASDQDAAVDVESKKKLKSFRYEMNKDIAKVLIIQYYNNNSMWSNRYKLSDVKRIKLKHFSKKRVVAHVEYNYSSRQQLQKFSRGVDKRTFTLIKHIQWDVISMGKHMSASF